MRLFKTCRSIFVLSALVSVAPSALANDGLQNDNATSVAPQIEARSEYYLGEIPKLAVGGLAAKEIVTVHMFRSVTRWVPNETGGWKPQPTLMHGWGRYAADTAGRIDLATARPIAGTSKAVGPTTLIWSARRSTDPLLAEQSFAQSGFSLRDNGEHILRVTRETDILAEHRFRINAERPDMTRVEIVTPELVGYFAAPAGASRLPVIIHLHGSEGNNVAKARDTAQRYAEAGFATFAVAYFAWPFEVGDLPLPTAHRNVPIELLDRARRWLASRPEADMSRIGLVGNSKGGEFAILGASYYPWVRAAVGCVPSDVVWQGYGAVTWENGKAKSVPPKGTYSSWSWQGQPLPYIPTYADQEGGFIDNTDRYDRARAEFSGAARAARIPIERTRARLFLIGGDRDRTWNSGTMVRSLTNAMDAAGRGSQVETLISATGGHSLCGDGLYPGRAWQEDGTSAFSPDIDAEGQAEVAAYAAKIAFLRDALNRRK
jgi:acetyl esterase/lipase